MKTSLFILFIFSATVSFSQSETTDRFHEDHDEARSLFFYRNTLRMFNMKDDPKIDELIRDIEKMKFLYLTKSESGFSREDYRSLVDNYHEEEFDDLMSMRADGSNFNILIREKNKITKGLVVLLDNEDDFAILDIKGEVPIDRVVELVGYVQSAGELDLDWD